MRSTRRRARERVSQSDCRTTGGCAVRGLSERTRGPGRYSEPRTRREVAGDPAYRGLYRILRRSAFASLAQTAREAALGEAQTLLGLLAFAQLGLIDFSEAPFHYRFREADQCSLSDSPALGAVRALAAVTRPAL